MKTIFKILAISILCILTYSCGWLAIDPPPSDFYSIIVDNQTDHRFTLYIDNEDGTDNLSWRYFHINSCLEISRIGEDESITDGISRLRFLEQYPIDIKSDDPLSRFFCDKDKWIKSDIDNGKHKHKHKIGYYTLTLEQEAFDELLEQTRAYYDNL